MNILDFSAFVWMPGVIIASVILLVRGLKKQQSEMTYLTALAAIMGERKSFHIRVLKAMALSLTYIFLFSIWMAFLYWAQPEIQFLGFFAPSFAYNLAVLIIFCIFRAFNIPHSLL